MSGVTIDVKIRTIATLIKEVKSGKFLLPSFQRRYEWDEDDIKELIVSIISNQPVGTIILWKPSNTSTDIDPFSVPLVDTGEKKPSEIFYVIDGQQRLTSLLLLFNNWRITRNGEEIKCTVPISYNPVDKKYYKSETRGKDLSILVKAFCLEDTDALKKIIETTSSEHLGEMKGRIGKILNYNMPIYTMETSEESEETFKDMAEAFIKVNKYGLRIGNLELMLSFLAGAFSGELKKRIRDLHDGLHQRFKIDLQPVIRLCFSKFGLKQTQISKVEQFKKNITRISEDTQKQVILDSCNKAMKLTIKLLQSELGIPNSSLLPSQTPLIPIASYLYARETDSLESLSREDIKNIVNWLILTSFNGYYSSHTDTKLDRDLEVIGKSNLFPWEKLLENMKTSKAKVKISFHDIERGRDLNVLRLHGKSHLFMLYILLVKNGADGWQGTLLNAVKFGELARHHIFPKEFLEERLELEDPDTEEICINNLANITFIHKEENSVIGDAPPEEYLPRYIDWAKTKHFIPIDRNLWRVEQYETFLEYRIKQIYLMGKELFKDIFE